MQPRTSDVKRRALLLVLPALTVLQLAAYAQPASLPRLEGVGAVVIDPGHGGKDQGTHSKTGVLEKDVNLAIATAVAATLRRQGISVILTRTNDRFVPLGRRIDVADMQGARLFVSIHCDSSWSASAKGFSVILARSPSEKASLAAEAISDSLDLGGRPYLVRRDGRGLLVLRANHSPALLLEVGFLSNRQEAADLADSRYRQEVAATIAQGILLYLRNE